MTEIHHNSISAIVNNRICDIAMRGVYTCSLVNGLGGLAILFADGRTLSNLTVEQAASAICGEFNVPEAFAIQAVAQVAGLELCGCGCGFAQDPHICPYKADVEGDMKTLCTCCKHCESNCMYDI